MKNLKYAIINSIVLLFAAYTICSAQAPGKMNYQAVLRDASGEILKNSHVTLNILILQGSPSGSAVFSETHSTSTNAFGLADLEIGSEDPTGFAGIDWADGPYYVKIRVNGTEMGTSQLLSVPYALYAKEAGGTGSSVWSGSGDNIYYNNGNVGINASDPKSKLSVGSNGRSNSSIFTYNNQPDGKGLTSDASGERGYAVYGESWGLNGMAIVGHAMNYHENSNYGGYFRTDGTEGIGVFGWATNDGRNRNIGGWFNARGELGIGVLASSPCIGGSFSATGDNAYAGVLGSASNNTGTNYGGYFTADSYGVYGEALSTEQGNNYGGYFKANGTRSNGVWAEGNLRGGYFTSLKDDGTVSYGVIGIAESTSTIRNYGGSFTAKGVNGVGVKGEADNSKGANNWGGFFTSNGLYGIGVRGYATNTADNQRNYGGYFVAAGKVGLGVYAEAKEYAGIGVIAYGGLVDFHASGPGTDYSPFTGAHEVKLTENFPVNAKEGMIVSTIGKAKARIDQNGSISISSTLPTIDLSNKVSDKAVFGVFYREIDKPEDHWNTEDFRLALINAVGEGRVLVTNINGDIENGDYITSSEIPGYGMKQDDDILHNYTLGKALEKVNWDEVTETIEYNGKTYKVYLIAVAYTSG